MKKSIIKGVLVSALTSVIELSTVSTLTASAYLNADESVNFSPLNNTVVLQGLPISDLSKYDENFASILARFDIIGMAVSLKGLPGDTVKIGDYSLSKDSCQVISDDEQVIFETDCWKDGDLYLWKPENYLDWREHCRESERQSSFWVESFDTAFFSAELAAPIQEIQAEDNLYLLGFDTQIYETAQESFESLYQSVLQTEDISIEGAAYLVSQEYESYDGAIQLTFVSDSEKESLMPQLSEFGLINKQNKEEIFQYSGNVREAVELCETIRKLDGIADAVPVTSNPLLPDMCSFHLALVKNDASEKQGDADSDGQVTLKDVMAVLKHYNLTEVLGEEGILTDEQIAAADVNSDGKTDTEDAVCIMKFCHFRDTLEEPKTWAEITGK